MAARFRLYIVADMQNNWREDFRQFHPALRFAASKSLDGLPTEVHCVHLDVVYHFEDGCLCRKELLQLTRYHKRKSVSRRK